MDNINKKVVKTQGNLSYPNLSSINFKNKNTLSLSRINTIGSEPKKHRYDATLFHKTIFHLKPMQDNPQLFTQDISLSLNQLKKLKFSKIVHNKAVIPHPITVKMSPIKSKSRIIEKSKSKKTVAQKESPIDRVLKQQTLTHITAKQWLIYNMRQDLIIKGYKYRQTNDIGGICKLLTFYTAYDIIRQDFIVISTFQILILSSDSIYGGLKVCEEQCLITMQDAFYALLMRESHDIAISIANNFGSYLQRRKTGKYFSCFDVEHQSKQKNIQVFLQKMKQHTHKLGLKQFNFSNPFGGNCLSTSLDVCKIASQCFKIPLFSKISATKRYTIRVTAINDHGQVIKKNIFLQNNNHLLGLGCLGGKVGKAERGGQNFIGVMEGSILIVVLGCAGKEERFSDWTRLAEWIRNKLQLLLA